MKKKERNKLDRKISEASGVAAYAISEAMTDEEAIEAVKYLEVFSLLKSSVNKNRNAQKQLTIKGKEKARQEERAKLEKFLNPQNSEIINAGKWLVSALSMQGNQRKETLKEKDLVHGDDHRKSMYGMHHTIKQVESISQELIDDDQKVIKDLERRVDHARRHVEYVEKQIIQKHGEKEWHRINNSWIKKANQ